MKINQLKAGAILSYMALILGTGISLIYTPYMLRALGQSEYGLFSLVNSTIAYLTILDFGFGNAIIRYTAKFRAENNIEKERSMQGMFLVLYTGIGVLAFLLGLMLIFNINSFFGESLTASELQTATILMWLAVINISITFPFSIFASIISAYERFVFSRITKIISFIINPLLMVVVLTLGYKSVGMIIVTTIITFVFNIINLIYCFQVLNIKIRFKGFDITLLKEISIYSFFIFLSIIVDRINCSTGQVLLGMFAGTAATSIYTIGSQMNQYYISIVTVVPSLLLPRLSKLVQLKEHDKINELYIRLSRLQFMLSAYILLGFLLIGRSFINIWAGAEYDEAYRIAILLMVSGSFSLFQSTRLHIMFALNVHKFRSIVYLCMALLNILVSIPLIKIYGGIGAAIGSAITVILGNGIIMGIYSSKVLRLSVSQLWKQVLNFTPVLVIVFLICTGIKNYIVLPPFIGLIVLGLIFTALFLVSIYFTGMNEYEKNLIKKMVSKTYNWRLQNDNC